MMAMRRSWPSDLMARDRAGTQAAHGERPARVAWVTNMAPPYRRPVWAAVAQSVDLRVVLLESDGQIASDHNNRGTDWLASHGPSCGYGLSAARTVKVRRGEARYYVCSPRTALSIVRGADVVLLGGWESPAYWFIRAAAWARRVRCVGFYESTENSTRHRGGAVASFRRLWFRSLGAVVTPGASATATLRNMGLARSRIYEGFNAVDVVSFHRAGTASTMPGPRPGPHRFIFVGQLTERKNVVRLVEAFFRLRGQGLDATLTLVGEGALLGQINTLVAASRYGEHVTVLGHLDNSRLPGVFAEHDTLVMPSLDEVWGLVANEALASGMHVIVSRRAGVARSIAGMSGVHEVDPDMVGSIVAGMRESQATFAGRIADPQILVHTPEAFAGIFIEAFHRLR
jgi:glycosyltransferase involved in cell wall biosynthesis